MAFVASPVCVAFVFFWWPVWVLELVWLFVASVICSFRDFLVSGSCGFCFWFYLGFADAEEYPISWCFSRCQFLCFVACCVTCGRDTEGRQ